MAGLPLKSGADFYNLEAARLRLHNLGADPTEVGAGLIYFNTSSGLNTSQKARLYTGSAWKTIAFSEDLDVASNADFLALKDRVDLLSGDVDTDAIISNMKEVSAFLEGFAEDASLMDYLNTELGKKLNKTGGEMTGKLVMYNRISMGNQVIEMGKGLFGAYNDGEKLYWLTPSNETWNEILTSAGGTIGDGSNDTPLNINGTSSNVALAFQAKGTAKGYLNWNSYWGFALVEPVENSNMRLGILTDGTPYFSSGSGSNTLIHSGNYSEYALPLSGGTMTGTLTLSKEGSDILVINRLNSSSSTTITYRKDNSLLGRMGFDASTKEPVAQVSGTYQTLLHSGNIGDYALKTDGSNKVQRGKNINWEGINDNIEDYDSFSYGLRLLTYNTTTANYRGGIHVGTRYGFQLTRMADNADNYLTIRFNDPSNNNAFGSWKTIAFTDSNVASATKLATPRTIWGQSFDGTGNVTGAMSYVENINFVGGWMEIGLVRNSSNAVQDLIIQANGGKPLSINPNGGNVLIGTTTDNGSGAKLYVNGGIRFAPRTIWGQSFDGTGDVWGNLNLHSDKLIFNSDAVNYFISCQGTTLATYNMYGGHSFCTAGGAQKMLINSSGNVTIGASDLAGTSAKLHVDGLTKAGALELGNIITLNRGYNSGAVLDSTKSALKIETYPSYVGFNIYTSGGTTRTNTLVLSDRGNVGIGTTNPQCTLDVSGNASIRDELFIQKASYSASGEGSFLIRYYNGVLQFNSRTADDVSKSYPLTINYDTDEATFSGDLHVKGNIIADGEVSAGGAAEEGGNAGGGGAFHSESIAVGATQTTIAHGLGTDDIVVSIYEKDGVSGRWSIILTDVEIVDANNIIVSFGSATTVEHKVVIMGAVA